MPRRRKPSPFAGTPDLFLRSYVYALASGVGQKQPWPQPEQPWDPAWAPMTDAEYAALVPKLRGFGCGLYDPWQAGRPMVADPRARLDAIFRLVTLRRPDGRPAPWRDLPPEFGKPDTVARTFRRWTARQLWLVLLPEVAHALRTDPHSPFGTLAWRLICCFRRGIRLMGLDAIVLARRLGLLAALHRPPHLLPDPDLSERYAPVFRDLLRYGLEHPGSRAPPAIFRVWRQMLRQITGPQPLPKYLQPSPSAYGLLRPW